MAIPQSFKEKYSLTGENYEKRNVDLALSDLFAASTRLYADNAELRRQIDALKAERNSLAAQLREAKSAPAPAPVSESSMTVRKLEEICRRLDALESKIGANAGVLGEKLTAIAEALSDAVVYTAADDALSADEEALADAEALEFAEEETVEEEEAEELSPEGASAAVRTVTVEPTLDFSEPIEEKYVEDEPIEEAVAEEAIIEDEPIEEESIEEVIIEEPVEEAPAEEAPIIEEAPVIEEESTAEEAIAESDEPSREEIIKAAGLEDEAEDIEPSEPIPDDNVAKMLAALYSAPAAEEETATEAAAEEAPAEEIPAEEAPAEEAPVADTGKVSGMRSSLDAIRRRREMKK